MDTDIIQRFNALIEESIAKLSPVEALKLLFSFEDRLYKYESQQAILYGGGIHPKHKHTKYHDFFINRISVGSRVLDIGCGNGALTFDIAHRVADVSVVGIDLNSANIAQATTQFSRKNISYIEGDVLLALPNQSFDVIVMSNFLEHIPDRSVFLQKLTALYNPKSFLIRVPSFERDWRVPVRAEIGSNYFLDPTHFIEYTKKEFENEMFLAALEIKEAIFNWGEIWAQCVAKKLL